MHSSIVITSLEYFLLPQEVELDHDCCESFTDGSLPIYAFVIMMIFLGPQATLLLMM